MPADNPLSYRILTVDLGINAPASWCIMTSGGTVHAKGVIHLACDEGLLNRLINRKRQYQQAGKECKYIYRLIRNMTTSTIARWDADFSPHITAVKLHSKYSFQHYLFYRIPRVYLLPDNGDTLNMQEQKCFGRPGRRFWPSFTHLKIFFKKVRFIPTRLIVGRGFSGRFKIINGIFQHVPQ